jgi:carbohydrate-selective porin OprB
MAVNQWFFLQPDLQYIMNPNGGAGNIEDAVVIGLRFGLTF